jgi:hypothetical protein
LAEEYFFSHAKIYEEIQKKTFDFALAEEVGLQPFKS